MAVNNNKPNKHVSKKPPPPTSADHAAEARKLKEEIEQLDAERAVRMKALLAKSKARKSS
jgi:hypothetical protein